MSYESVRAALTAYIETSWNAGGGTIPLEKQNIAQIDHDTAASPFVTLQIKWRDGAHQASIDVVTTHVPGELVFHIHVKQGEGVKPATLLADRINAFMKYQKISNVQILAPRLLPPQEYRGWEITSLAFSFFYRE